MQIFDGVVYVAMRNLHGPEHTGVVATYRLWDEEENQRPNAPSNVTSAGETADSITLTWDAADDPDTDDTVTSYNVYMSRNQDTVHNLVTGTTVTSFQISGLQSGVMYYFVVKAVDEHGAESPASNVFSATTR
jgi:fibronectin type 3 domain-containing protein